MLRRYKEGQSRNKNQSNPEKSVKYEYLIPIES